MFGFYCLYVCGRHVFMYAVMCVDTYTCSCICIYVVWGYKYMEVRGRHQVSSTFASTFIYWGRCSCSTQSSSIQIFLLASLSWWSPHLCLLTLGSMDFYSHRAVICILTLDQQTLCLLKYFFRFSFLIIEFGEDGCVFLVHHSHGFYSNGHC